MNLEGQYHKAVMVCDEQGHTPPVDTLTDGPFTQNDTITV